MRIFCPATVRPSLVPPVCPTHAVGRVAPLLARTTLSRTVLEECPGPSRPGLKSLAVRRPAFELESSCRHGTPRRPRRSNLTILSDGTSQIKSQRDYACRHTGTLPAQDADRPPQFATSPAGIGLVPPYCGDKSPVVPEIARWRGRRPSCHSRGRGRAVEAGWQRGGRRRRHDAGELR